MSNKKKTESIVSKRVELEELIEKKKIKNMPIKSSSIQIISYIFLAISFVSMVVLFILTIMNSNMVIEQLSEIISVSLLAVFSIFFIFCCLSASESKKGPIFVLIASFLFASYTGFLLLEESNILHLPTQSYVENFTNKSLTEVIAWAQKNKITVEQTLEPSDSVKEYYVISQNIKEGTLIKGVSTLNIIVSSGPDTGKEVVFANMIGKNVDEVINFVEKNFFTNVVIEFISSDEERDIVIEQSKSGMIARYEEIKIIVSLGRGELEPVSMENMRDRSSFYATTWLKRNGIKYKIEYSHSDTVSKGNVISQSVESGTMVNPNSDEVTIVISKGNKITAPNFMNMDMESITSFIIDNKLKIEFSDQYDDSILLGKVIAVNKKEGDILEEGDVITVVISKGQLKMEKFNSPVEYRAWAEKYNISYKEETVFSDNTASGQIIKTSHEVGSTIKNGDTIIITVSQGRELVVPKLVGKSKTDAQKACNSADIKCSFIYGGYSETINKDIVTKQSKSEGSKVASGTNITVTLSSGIIEKVVVPNFIGKNQSTIQSLCNNLGITCKFVTESSFSSTPSGNATRQSASGRMNKGSVITVYLSKGSAKSFSVTIQPTWFGTTYNETVSSIRNKLESACPGVTFVFKAKDVNEGAGMISSDSSVKSGNNTFVQGNTYVITINR